MKSIKIDFRIIEIICATLLILLWALTASDKLTNFAEFKLQLDKQVFSKGFVKVLLYAIPLAELIAAILLVFGKTRRWGFVFSVLILSLFTGYIGLVLAGYYQRVPCGCVSVISGMGFTAHFFFNLFFTAMAVIGFIFTIKAERRNSGMGRILSHAPLTA